MSGGSCAVIIVTRQAATSAETIEQFAADGLLAEKDKDDTIKASKKYVDELNRIANGLTDE